MLNVSLRNYSKVNFNTNTLFYGDNFEILRHLVPDESIDLIYLDPPFNSKADYNVLFKETSGEQSTAQIQAFSDFWKWDVEARRAYEYLTGNDVDSDVANLATALYQILEKSAMSAYLFMMARRLIELKRVLKPTGSLYLHCDPTASHYLKLTLDAIFGTRSFRNEIIWKRTFAHGSADRWGDVHDTIFLYSKTDNYTWTKLTQAHEEEYLDDKYRFEDDRGRYRLVVLTGPGTTLGPSGKKWRGYDPSIAGRHWAVPRRCLSQLENNGIEIPENLHEQLELLYQHGYIRFPEKKDGSRGVPEFKLYLSEKGSPIQDIISDISPVNSQAQERLGYPTQKPIKLLERIIAASSKENDWVLDPFCGCGTAIVAVEKLRRHWIGIDIT